MHKHVYAAGLCVVLMGGPAIAADTDYYPHVGPGSPLLQPQSVVSANVDVFAGLAFGGGDDASGTVGVFGGIGRVNVPLQGVWNLQVDVQGISMSSYNFLDDSTLNLDHKNVGAYAYFYKRQGNWTFGPYFGVENRASSDDWSSKVLGVLFGPQHGPWEYHGLANVSWVASATDNGWGLGGQFGVQYWMDPNTMFGADLAYNYVGIAGTSTNVFTAAVTALHRFDSTPFAVFGQGRIDAYSGGTDATLATLLVGSRIYANPAATTAEGDMQTGPAWTWRLPLPANL